LAGEPLAVAQLGWHGLDGDQRLAFRRIEDHCGFPWLTAVKLPDLVRFTPQRRGAGRNIRSCLADEAAKSQKHRARSHPQAFVPRIESS
jgi:hypothetical protein